MSDFGLDEAERWLADWSVSVSQRAKQSQQLADRVSAFAAVASSTDDRVRVTVDSSGQIIDLELTDRVRGLAPARLASVILETMRTAQSKLPALVAAAAAETVGADSPSAQAVIAAFERRFPTRGPRDGRA